MKTRLAHSKGFTLLELMIVLAIIAILTAIAYPSYQDRVRKSRRATAQADLLVLVNFMERTFTESNSYKPGGVVVTLPYTASPKSGTQSYTLSLSASDSSSYTLQAAPLNGSPQASDTCGTMTITHTGAKTPVANCW